MPSSREVVRLAPGPWWGVTWWRRVWVCIRGFSEATGMPQVDWKQVEGGGEVESQKPAPEHILSDLTSSL